MSDAREIASPPTAVVFDVGRVLFRWDMRCLFTQLIADPAELDWFLSHVVTEEWHHQHDEGRPLDEMVPELVARFPKNNRHRRWAPMPQFQGARIVWARRQVNRFRHPDLARPNIA